MPNGARGGPVETQWPDNRCWGKKIAGDGCEAQEAAAKRREPVLLSPGVEAGAVYRLRRLGMSRNPAQSSREAGRAERPTRAAADRGVAVPRVGGMAVGQQGNLPRPWPSLGVS